jgi:FixJ family two-component response regulator
LFDLSQILLTCTSVGWLLPFSNDFKAGMSEAPLIAIVDDDALARDGIGELVASLGYEAVTFSSAQHFLASSVITKTTCLITDLQMPGLNGLELQEATRSQGYCTPVILVTAYPNEQNRKRALDNGAVGVLNKPFDEGLLIRCINAAIKRSASAE